MIATHHHTTATTMTMSTCVSGNNSKRKFCTSDNFNPTLTAVNSLASDASSVAKSSECPRNPLSKAGGASSASPGAPAVTSPSSSLAPADSLPPTYAALPQTTKLDEEPNPFEQSFSSSRIISKETRLVLPPLTAIDSPAAWTTVASGNGASNNGMTRKDEIVWDSLRASPLSPSMLMGPAGQQHQKQQEKRPPMARGSSYLTTSSSFSSNSSSISSPFSISGPQRSSPLAKYESEPQHYYYHHHHHHYLTNRAQEPSSTSSLGAGVVHNGPRSDNDSAGTSMMTTLVQDSPSTLAYIKSTNTTPTADNSQERPTQRRCMETLAESKPVVDEEEKRKNFLERNRQAALKCRQRKKQWVQDLQDKVKFLTAENGQLQMDVTALREQLFDLKSILLEHKTCRVNPQAVIDAVNRPIPGMVPRTIYHPHGKSRSPSASTPPPIRYASYSHSSSTDYQQHYYTHPSSSSSSSSSSSNSNNTSDPSNPTPMRSS